MLLCVLSFALASRSACTAARPSFWSWDQKRTGKLCASPCTTFFRIKKARLYALDTRITDLFRVVDRGIEEAVFSCAVMFLLRGMTTLLTASQLNF